ncbi:MAG: glycosyltransferase family 2 protein [Chloroflexota bacterium]|nr:glycosyltransferase family 2 protein [Chloroflexota bacterium]
MDGQRVMGDHLVTFYNNRSSRLKIVAAIPCFNEAQYIGEVVNRTKKHVNEVIVVDDGSNDSTSMAAGNAGAIVIRHNDNGGYGRAIRSCFKESLIINADALVTIDGDAQHDPDDIPRVLAPVLNGEADLVIGSRFLSNSDGNGHSIEELKAEVGDGTGSNSLEIGEPLATTEVHRDTRIPELGSMPGYRKLGISAITWLFNVGSNPKVSDAQSGLRAYSRRFLEEIIVKESGMGVSVEVLVQARTKRFKICEVPISCGYYSESSTSNPFVHGFRVAVTLVRMRVTKGDVRLPGYNSHRNHYKHEGNKSSDNHQSTIAVDEQEKLSSG